MENRIIAGSDGVMIEEPIKNSGLIVAPSSPENYHSKLFGAVGEEAGGIISPVEPPVIFENGIGWKKVWLDYGMPELQFNRYFDSFSCVLYAILKACCLYLFKVYGIKTTMSEMYNAFYAGVISGQGTTIEKGMESVRKHGWIEDLYYQFTADTTETEFRQRPPLKINLMAEGKLKEFTVFWNVIPTSLIAIFKAYRRTPVVLTGFAWASLYGEGVFYDNGNPANHAFLGLEGVENGNNLISDTYPKDFNYVENSQINASALIKELDKSFHYGSAHTVWLVPNTQEKTNLFLILKNMIDTLFAWFDNHGLHVAYVPKDSAGKVIGKQVIDMENTRLTLKALMKTMYDKGFFKKSDWPSISAIPDLEEAKQIK